MQIRSAVIDEQKIIASFQMKMALETEDLHLNPEIIGPGVEAVFKDSSKGKYFVAANENNIVGSFLITYEWSDWRNATIWWLQSLYVIPEWRSKGVFSAMFHFIQQRMKETDNVCGLRLYVDQSNKKAQMIYTHLGMKDDHYRTFEWMK